MIKVGTHDDYHPVIARAGWQAPSGPRAFLEPESPPPWILFVHGDHEDAKGTCKMPFDIGNRDAEPGGDFGIAEFLDTDREEDLAVHLLHPIDGALGAPQAKPVFAGIPGRFKVTPMTARTRPKYSLLSEAADYVDAGARKRASALKAQSRRDET
nr:hypothetical protein [Sphingopyxis sp. P1IMeth2]